MTAAGRRTVFFASLLLQALVLGAVVLREERAIEGGRTVFLEVNRTQPDRSRSGATFRPNLTLRRLNLADVKHNPEDFPDGETEYSKPMWLRLEPDLPVWRPAELTREPPPEGDTGLWLRCRGTRGMVVLEVFPGRGRPAPPQQESVQLDLALRRFYHPLAMDGRTLADEVFPEDGPLISARISVSEDGRGTVMDLLVGEVSWDEWIRDGGR